MLRVGLQITGLKKLQKRLTSLKTLDFKPELMAMGGHMKRSVAQTFREQKDPKTGQAWQPLAGSTVRRRRKGRRKGGSRKILRDTAALSQSISGEPPKITAKSVSLGSRLKYARIHQRGGEVRITKRRGRPLKKPYSIRIPQRRYLGWKDGDRKMLVDLVSRKIRSVMGVA